MSSKLKAGTSSSGAVLDADTTGILELQTGSTPTTAVTIDTSQKVGIGTTSPTSRLQIGDATVSTSNGIIFGKYQAASQGNLPAIRHGSFDGAANDLVLGATSGTGTVRIFTGAGDSSLEFGTTSNAERMRIDSSGNLLLNTTSVNASGLLSISGSGTAVQGMTIKNTNGSNNMYYCFFLNSSSAAAGSIQQTGATTVNYVTSSDYRLKEDIAPITNALDKVSALKPVTYKWKEDKSFGEGFVAHELAEICPLAVTGEKDALDKDGNILPQGIDPSKLVATLTAAIQELNAKVNAQALEIQALKGTA